MSLRHRRASLRGKPGFLADFGPFLDFVLEAGGELLRRAADRFGALAAGCARQLSGSLTKSTISRLSLLTISAGVPAGTNTPCQELIS